MIRKVLALVPRQYCGAKRKLLAAIVVQSLCQVLAYLLLVPLLRALFDGRFAHAWIAIACMVPAVAGVAVFTYLQSAIGLRIGVGMQQQLQTELGNRLNSVPLGWFETRDTANLSRVVVESVREVQGVVAYLLAKIIPGMLVPVGVAVGMLFVDWRLAVAMLISAPVLILVDSWSNRVYAVGEQRLHAAAAEADSRVLEFAQAQPVLRAFGAVGAGNRALTDALHRRRAASAKLVIATVPGLVLFGLVVQVGFMLLVYLTVLRFTAGELSSAAAIALLVVSSRFIEPMKQVTQLSTALRSAGSAAERITELLSAPALPEPETEQPIDGTPEIVFDNVGFGYDDGPSVLSDVTFTAAAGTTTAIVGPSGAGKTTLLRLVARFADVQAGRILVGGHDVREQRSAALLRLVSLVFQDVYLFDQTVLENVRVGDSEASDDRVRQVGTVARVDEIVDRLPEGWNTMVGEAGAALSGGERQRVSVARALLKDAPIVLLDEATSALDPHSEAAVARGIHELTRNKTVLVVAHRLDTIAHADQILFLEQGRIIERGTHAELLDRQGRYAEFWHERSRATGWRLSPAKV